MNESPKFLKSFHVSDELKPHITPLFESSRPLVKAHEVQTVVRLDEIVKAAQEAAALMITEAESAAKDIREEAAESGYREGFSQVVSDLAKVRAEREALLQEAELEALELAFALTRRILGHAIEETPELIQSVVREVSQSARGRRSLMIRVHPDDLPLVLDMKHELAESLEGAAVYFDDDGTLARGECAIDTEAGRIDGRLETQLQILRDALEGR